MKDLIAKLDSKTKKVAEAESYIRRLEAMKDHSKELISYRSDSKRDKEDDYKWKHKCPHEKSGKCN